MTMKPAMAQTSPAIASQVSGMSCHAGRVPASLRSSLMRAPHAHRKNAAVGAITRIRTSRTMRMDSVGASSRRRLLRGEDEVQVLQHAGRGAPDVALAIRHRVVAPLAALVWAAGDLVIDLVEEVFERHFEHVSDFARLRTNRKSRCHDPDDWRDLESRAGVVAIDGAHDVDECARNADLLLGLAQGGGDRVLARLASAAGKGDLA